MPVKPAAGGRLVFFLALLVVGVAGALLLAGMLDTALAQGGPFGGPRSSTPTAPAAADGIIGWLFAKQAEFNIAMRGFLRQAKSDGSAIWALLGVSFLYGVFHAAGPGHGKAVISSYVVANEETWKRGVVLSFASAFLQAVVAIAFVGIARLLLNATQKMMCDAERVIEMASYALIVLVGLRLLWVKGRAMIGAVKMVGRPVAEVGAAVTREPHEHHDHSHGDHGHHHDHGHEHHHHGNHHHAHEHAHAAHAHHHHDHHGHAHHDHDHDHASAWGHAHAPEPQELAGPGGWRRGLSAVLAVGIRPCSGAIIVLVFAMAQGLFWAGAASTFVMALGTAITVATIATIAVTARSFAQGLADQRSSFGTLAIRGIEVAASLLIIAFGGLLLAGYMFSERLPLC